jgi:F-type H+-transporting ATPase subunit delta
VTLRTLARRYAGALFDVTSKAGVAADADRDLQAFRQLVVDHPDLARVFESPGVPPQNKRAIVEELLQRIGNVCDQVQRLLLMLAERDRLALLPDVATEFGERLMQARRIVVAEIVTAAPIPESQRATLAAALGKAADSHVTLVEEVNPAIIGGLVARVGGAVFDASITRQIERLRQRLLTEA